MENQNSSSKIMLTYGAILGVVSIIISVANYSFGNMYQQHWSVSLINFIVMVAVLVLGIKAFKESNGGFLKLGQAVKLGLGIAVISSIIGIIYLLIFTNVIEPDFHTNMAIYLENMYYEKFPDMPEEQIEKMVEMGAKFSNPMAIAIMSLVMSVVLGLIISLIAGAVMKNEEEVI